MSDLDDLLAILSPKQREIALIIAHEGLLNKELAYKLNNTEATIKFHVGTILRKLKVDRREQLIIKVLKATLSKSEASLPSQST